MSGSVSEVKKAHTPPVVQLSIGLVPEEKKLEGAAKISPMGVDNFYKVVSDKRYLYCDKTIGIVELFSKGDEVTLWTRPRRWGKSLFLSMIQYFVAARVKGKETRGLFDQFAIAQVEGGKHMRHQGQYQAIFVTFKDIKNDNFEKAISDIGDVIRSLYLEYLELADSQKLSPLERELFNKIASKKADESELRNSLLTLSRLLQKHYGQQVFILIDEYDTPLTHAYIQGYLKPMAEFMGRLLSAALKSNDSLAKGVMTGIMWVSYESILSGLNLIRHYTFFESDYQSCFGFTEPEVIAALKACGVSPDNFDARLAEIRKWYNGYKCVDTVLYNPWSILSYIASHYALEVHWVNTGSNTLVKEGIAHASPAVKEKLQALMLHESITVNIDKQVLFTTFIDNETAFWSLMLSIGYLKVDEVQRLPSKFYKCRVSIPNQELWGLYKDCIIEWFFKQESSYHSFLNHLVKGDADAFAKDLGNYLLQTVSLRNLGGDQRSELFYHGFCLAMLAALSDQYHLRSDRESGLGYYDVILIPKEPSRHLAIILEFKHAKVGQNQEEVAKKALKQIDKKLYTAELTGHKHITKVLKIGLAFMDKSVVVAHQTVDQFNSPLARKDSGISSKTIDLVPLSQITDTEEDEDGDETMSVAGESKESKESKQSDKPKDKESIRHKRKRDEMERNSEPVISFQFSSAGEGKGDSKKNVQGTGEAGSKRLKASPSSSSSSSSSLAAGHSQFFSHSPKKETAQKGKEKSSAKSAVPPG